MLLVLCKSCHRHVRVGSTTCPFCSAALGRSCAPTRRVHRAAAVLVGIGFAMLSCACYGPPPSNLKRAPNGEPQLIEEPAPPPDDVVLEPTSDGLRPPQQEQQYAEPPPAEMATGEPEQPPPPPPDP